MKRLLGLALVSLLALAGCGAGPMAGGGGGDIHAVNHIVIFMQENRSFDHYFSQLNNYRSQHGYGASDVDVMNPANVSLKTWDGSPNVSPFHMVSMCSANLTGSWLEAHQDLSLAQYPNPTTPYAMDGFVYTAGGFCAHTGCADTQGARAVGYYTDADLPFYYWGATQFATSDRWFSPGLFRTQPSRMYLLAATSAGHAYEPTSPQTSKTIFQLLQENNITWKVYVTNGVGGNPPTGSTYMNYYPDFTNAHTANFVPATQFATDAANGTLPQVSLIESGYESGQDEHPDNNVQVGALYAHDLVKALVTSPSWKDSVMFLTFDEGGGLYDHVQPFAEPSPDGIPPQDLTSTDPPGDFTSSGFRVPLVIFSPFAKPGYVSHTNADFTAMLKFIETRFGLPPLTKRDAAQPDMTEFFDFAHSPNLNPGNVPDQPTSGPCYADHLP